MEEPACGGSKPREANAPSIDEGLREGLGRRVEKGWSVIETGKEKDGCGYDGTDEKGGCSRWPRLI